MSCWRKWRRPLAGLFNRLRKPADAIVAPKIPDGQRVYCIGDIHGRADLLAQLHKMILSDAAGYRGAKTILYLGDYIDRGEESRQVIETLLSQPLPDWAAVHLLGNHEHAMLDFMQHPEAAAGWLSFGGRETLLSYGIVLTHIPTVLDLPMLAGQLVRKLPDSHLAFLHNCTESWRCGSYYFVHAGIRPGVALDQQTREDQLWIREEFLYSNANHGVIVVHGHSISEQVEQLPNRIGIDTGAFATGVLTCLVLEADQSRLLQTGNAG